MPVFAAIDDYQDFLGQLLGLGQREDFEEFVHGAEAAGEDNKSLGEIAEPELTHEEVVKLKIERRRDVGITHLLEGQIDVQTNGFATGFVRAQVGGFHNAGTSTGGHHKAAAASG